MHYRQSQLRLQQCELWPEGMRRPPKVCKIVAKCLVILCTTSDASISSVILPSVRESSVCHLSPDVIRLYDETPLLTESVTRRRVCDRYGCSLGPEGCQHAVGRLDRQAQRAVSCEVRLTRRLERTIRNDFCESSSCGHFGVPCDEDSDNRGGS